MTKFRRGSLTWGAGWLVCGALLSISGCRAETTLHHSVREPVVAGVFYPGESATLQAEVDAALHPEMPPEIQGRTVALLVPHAGYSFSGPTAGMGWSVLASAPVDTVYVIGTAHHMSDSGAAVWVGDAFKTPLGEYPVDRPAVNALLEQCPDIHDRPAAWSQEHSVEVQVPFLQRVLPNAKLVPLILGPSSAEQLEAIAAALARRAAHGRTLVVASADLSHYPRGEDAVRVDQALLKSLAQVDAAQFRREDARWMNQGVPQLECTVCGKDAVEVVVRVARAQGATRAQVLHYTHSGEISGEQARVVGYAAVAFVVPEGPGIAATVLPEHEAFTSDQGSELLQLAEQTLRQALSRKAAETSSPVLPAWMQAKRGVFVTLKQKQELRGCIGLTEPVLPLAEAVPQMARAAAFDDPRFQALRSEEWERTSLEISVLSPLHKIRSPQDIRLGRDGVVVRAQGKTGLFLPQVAEETGWDLETFMNELCAQKAHLPPQAWRDPHTELWVFTVQVFAQAASKE